MSFYPREKNLNLQHNNYILPHVGNNKSDNDTEYNKKQKDILDRNKTKVPNSYDPPYDQMYTTIPGLIGTRNQILKEQHDKSDRYDPLGDYLYKKGLMDRDNVTRYITNYVNIDSSTRQVAPSAQVKWIQLKNNPLSIKKFDYNLFISQPGHNFTIGDKIGISGVQTLSKTIKIIINGIKKIDFVDGSSYMRIYTDTGLSLSQIDLDTYDISALTVTISGIQGYPGKSFIQNIPINTINTTHSILLTNPEDDPQVLDSSVFYIQLSRPFSGIYNPVTAYNISLTFNYIAGIPVNLINSEYPVNMLHQQGFQTIIDTTSDGYYVELSQNAAETLTLFGGSNIYVGLVDQIDIGFPDQNHYIIKLGNTYSNIVLVKFKSSEFMNTEKIIRNVPSEKQNNKLYWQNLDDGDHVYSIEAQPGNYSPNQLAAEIQRLVLLVPRINPVSLGGDITNTTYDQNNYITVDINTTTDIVTFNSFNRAQLFQPLVSVNPPITTTSLEQQTYTITIEQINHGLFEGDIITITGAIAYYGIPASVLNGAHTITHVIDDNQYEIQVSNVNLETVRTNTGGGATVNILVPNNFKLRFDYIDTMGQVLGFRNPGKPASITDYQSEIKNLDPYYMEPLYDDSGNPTTITNNALSFTGDNYIIVTCEQFKGFNNEGEKIKDIFAKILLCHPPGTRLFNTYVHTPLYYHNPIPSITELEFTFYSPDGNLYDFNGLDHSFTLEIVSLTEIPKGTGIASNIGKIN
jgi:hypothetical protein